MKDWGLSQLSVPWIALIVSWCCFRMINTSGHMHPWTSASLITLQDVKNKDIPRWQLKKYLRTPDSKLSIYYYQWFKNQISKCASWKTPLSAGLVVIWFNQYSFDFLVIWEQHNNLKCKKRRYYTVACFLSFGRTMRHQHFRLCFVRNVQYLLSF